MSLTRRLGNVNNELSVFVMNKTTEMLQEMSTYENTAETDGDGGGGTEGGEGDGKGNARGGVDKIMGIVSAANDLLDNSKRYLEKVVFLLSK